MADRYLKHIPSGQIFIHQPAFAGRDDFIEVADLKGTPLNVIDGEYEVVEAPKKRGRKKSDEDALEADASRGL